MKICFTTALFGDPKTLDKPAKFERNPNYDYFLFTDIDEEDFDTSWDIINIRDNSNIHNLTSNVRKSRYPKFMSWELLESMEKHYDVIFYCDGFYHPRKQVDWEEFAKQIKKENTFPFVQTHHYKKSIREGGIEKELHHVVESKRDTQETIDKTIKFLSELDSNVDLDTPCFYENTCFGYSFENKNVRALTQKFWEIYTTEDITYRDQALWNFLLLKYNYHPIVFNMLKPNPIVGKNKKLGTIISFFCADGKRGTMRENYTKGQY